MRKEVLLMIAAVMTAVFFGCDDTIGNEGAPATKVTITAVDGTDFGNVSLGKEVTKKFRIKTDGYIGSWSYSLPLGFESSDLENLLKSLEETAGTTGEFSVTFSPLFNGKSSGDIVINTGAEGTLAVTAVGSGTALKAPDAEDRTFTYMYAYPNSVGMPVIDSDAITLQLYPHRPVGFIIATADYYVDTQDRATHSGFINYDYSGFPNDPAHRNMVTIQVTVNQTYPAEEKEKSAFFFIEGRRIDIIWSE